MIEAAYSEEGPESRSAEPSLCPHPWGGCSLHWQNHILLSTYRPGAGLPVGIISCLEAEISRPHF